MRMRERREIVRLVSLKKPVTLKECASHAGVVYGTLRHWEREDEALEAELNVVRARRRGDLEETRNWRRVEAVKAMRHVDVITNRRSVAALRGAVWSGVSRHAFKRWMQHDPDLCRLVEGWAHGHRRSGDSGTGAAE